MAWNLISGLLTRDPAARLGGSKLDALELMNHPFYRSIDWVEVAEKRLPPPFDPLLQGEDDTRYIEKDFLDLQTIAVLLGDEDIEK